MTHSEWTLGGRATLLASALCVAAMAAERGISQPEADRGRAADSSGSGQTTPDRSSRADPVNATIRRRIAALEVA